MDPRVIEIAGGRKFFYRRRERNAAFDKSVAQTRPAGVVKFLPRTYLQIELIHALSALVLLGRANAATGAPSTANLYNA